MYKLKYYYGDDTQGSFYEQELQKVRQTDDLYGVEKVTRKRKRKGKTEYFVKWLGYLSKLNTSVTDLQSQGLNHGIVFFPGLRDAAQ